MAGRKARIRTWTHKHAAKVGLSQFYKGKVVGNKHFVSGDNASAVLDAIEEALNLIAVAVQTGLKQIGCLRFRFGGLCAQAPRILTNS